VLLRVREGERAPPRPAEHLPSIDAEMGAESLDVVDERPRGVVDQAGVGSALVASTLIEADDAVGLGVEEAAVSQVAGTSRTAVEEDDRLAVGVAALLPVDLVDVGDLQHARAIRFDLRVEGASLPQGRGCVAPPTSTQNGTHAGNLNTCRSARWTLTDHRDDVSAGEREVHAFECRFATESADRRPCQEQKPVALGGVARPVQPGCR
jgi:hypothetical protein